VSAAPGAGETDSIATEEPGLAAALARAHAGPAAASAAIAEGLPQSLPAPSPSERCPLCGSGLDPRQDWCLRCGAAARTRLAATPRWWVPVCLLGVVIVVSLGVLVASLVKLAG
jgi:hypothetical protein